ncbi:MAG: sigma-70 family RNA polymerase sigma factor, partial [Clostridia bacterium]
MELLSNEMVNKAISGDTEAVEQLTKRFMPLFRAYSNSYFILGGDKEDVIQEGMLGLFFAMRDYKKEYCDFEPFAKSCIRHRILTAIRLANAKKHLPLNN